MWDGDSKSEGQARDKGEEGAVEEGLNERHIVCADLNRAIDDLRLEGFRLDSIYPADDPSTALLSRAGETVRLTLPGASPLPEGPPPFAPEFVLTRAGETPRSQRVAHWAV